MFGSVTLMNNFEFSRGLNSGGVTRGSVPSGPSMFVDPYFVKANDLDTGKSIVKEVLQGKQNYASLKVSMEISLSAKSQLGFVKEEYPKPSIVRKSVLMDKISNCPRGFDC